MSDRISLADRMKEYERAGLPWFDLYHEHLGTIEGSDKLRGVKSVKDMDKETSKLPMQDDGSVEVPMVKKLRLERVTRFL